MVPKVASTIRSRREQLRRLAIVFKNAIRLKIVSELYIREMSPKEFFEEFGGGSVERVAQHFEVLERHGWLRSLGHKDRHGRRRGKSETLYRATEPPFFDAETWALLPYSVRLAFSWSSFQAIAPRMRDGIEASCLEGRLSRDLSCKQLELDPFGWSRIIRAIDALFESIFEEQDDAKIRIARTGEDLIRAGVFLSGFESPRGDERLALCLADGSAEPPMLFPERLSPIFADDLCMKIVAELNKSDMSVKQFHREFGGDASEWVIRHRFNRLTKLAWLARVDKIKRRGAYEFIYRATKPAVDNGSWTDVPRAVGDTKAWTTFERCSDLIKEAIIAGTFDMRDDRHLSWSILSLDLEGWRRVVVRIEDLYTLALAEQDQAEKRIESGAKPMTMTVALLAVESPMGPAEAF